MLHYCVYRIEQLTQWMDGVELIIQKLEDENVSSLDYHQTVEKFQVANLT